MGQDVARNLRAVVQFEPVRTAGKNNGTCSGTATREAARNMTAVSVDDGAVGCINPDAARAVGAIVALITNSGTTHPTIPAGNLAVNSHRPAPKPQTNPS